jgi:hypothetical protein
MASHNKGKAPSQNVRNDIDNYCDFLVKQEQKKQKEILDLISDKTRSSTNKPKDNKPKRSK